MSERRPREQDDLFLEDEFFELQEEYGGMDGSYDDPYAGRRPGRNAGAGSRGSAPHRPRRSFPVHLILLLLILALAAGALIRLVIWNRGSRSNYDPDAVDTRAVSVEVSDFIVPLTPDRLEGHADDGVTRILLLGGTPFTEVTGEKGLPEQILAQAQARSAQPVEIVCAAFPGSRVTCLGREYDPSTPDGQQDIFNLFYVAYGINTEDFAGHGIVAGTMDDPAYTAAAETLRDLDFETIDMIVIMYGDSDYVTRAPAANDNPNDISSYAGSLKRSFELIREKYPFIRIVFMSPVYIPYVDEDGAEHNPATYDLGHGELVGYNAYAFMACSETGTSYIDNFAGSVNALNYPLFVKDGRLNDDGRTEIAHHFAVKLIEGDASEYRPVAGPDQDKD